jgi:hypothetical protein
MLSEKILVPQSVLQSEQDCARVQKRRNQSKQGLVVRRFQRDQHQVARPDRISGFVGLRSGNVKICFFPTDANARSFNFRKSASYQEMNIAAVLSELAAVKTANRACSDDGDFHLVIQTI